MLSSAFMTGCQIDSYGVVFNDSDHPITITVEGESVAVNDADSAACALMRPRAREGSVSDLPAGPGLRPGNEWASIDPSTFNEAECRIELVLQPGFSVAIFREGACSDGYERFRGNPDVSPTLRLFRVSGPMGTVEYRGWEAARHFARLRNGFCVFQGQTTTTN